MYLHAIVVGDHEHRPIAERHGFDWLWWSNERMGVKWNAAFAHAADEGADYFTLIGSDDWIHPSAFATLSENAISAAPAIDFVDLDRRVLQHASADRSIPWIIPRSLFGGNFTPLPDRMQRGTETMLWAALGRPQFWHRGGTPAVDFKTAESTSPYAGVANSIGDGLEHDAAEALLSAGWPEHLVKEIA